MWLQILVWFAVSSAPDGWEFPFGGDDWSYPLSARFGESSPRGFHAGLDVGAPCGTPVRAMRSGRVVSVRAEANNGIHVVVRSPDSEQRDLYVQYGHLSRVRVRRGCVIRGQVLGRTGKGPGGCHLHVAIRRGQAPVSGRVEERPETIGYLDPEATVRPERRGDLHKRSSPGGSH